MQDQRDNGRADAIKNRCHPRKPPKIDIERAKRSYNQEIGQDKGPAARPCAPEAAAKIGGKNAYLDRERSRKRLCDGYGIPHLLFSKPASVLDQLLLHQSTQCYRAAEAKGTKTQKIADKFPDSERLIYWRSVSCFAYGRIFHDLLNCAYRPSKHSKPFERISWSLRPCLAQPLNICSTPNPSTR